MNRRDLLRLSFLLGTASAVGSGAKKAEGKPNDDASSRRITDTNVSLSHWPFRRLPLDEPELLVNKLRSLGISAAWAGSFEGILHRDLTSANQRLAATCARHPELVPIGSINLDLPDWEEDLRRCIEEHEMPGVRLHPNYHGYQLDDPRFGRLLTAARDSKRFVQVAACLEDTRTQHPLLNVPDVDLSLLPEVMQHVPGATVQILNYRPRQPLLGKLAATPGIYFDTARVEATDGIAELLANVPSGRVMFGTHAPFLIPESAMIRIHESNPDVQALAALLSGTAEELRRRSADNIGDQ